MSTTRSTADKKAEAIIKVEHVDLWYDRGKPNEVHALKDMTFEIERGDHVALFGPSGCGKTTMLYALAGIDRYQGGTITVNGQDITGLSNQDLAIFRQTGIGIIFQQFNLIPSLTVLQNVALPMAFLGVSSLAGEKEARKLLERLGMAAYAHRYPFELSGGQQQRVGIARALANNPPILIADEPLGNLDSANAKNVLAFLKELNEKDGRTIIMVTHEAWTLRDVKTIFYMKDGAFTEVEEQTPETAADSLVEHLHKELTDGEAIRKKEELSVQAFSTFLLSGYSMDEIRRFENLLRGRMSGDIDAMAFREGIDRPFKAGGVGLWRHKAARIAERVEGFIDQRYDIEAIGRIVKVHPELPIAEEVRRIREWLTLEYRGALPDEQRMALEQAISDLIRNFISVEKFEELLQRSLRGGGVGLSFRAAEQFTEKMEVVLSGKEWDNMSREARNARVDTRESARPQISP